MVIGDERTTIHPSPITSHPSPPSEFLLDG
jgi:hypothetical protein